MKETLLESLERLGVTLDQFGELAGVSRDDLEAISGGSSVPCSRVTAILRLVKSAGRAKIAPIIATLAHHSREWRTVVGFPAYEVSDDGFVRRSAPSNKGSLRTLKAVMKNHGYYSVTLYRGGAPEPQRIHRLVCEAFHGPAPTGKPFVCHRDGTRTNNQAANLYWAYIPLGHVAMSCRGNCLCKRTPQWGRGKAGWCAWHRLTNRITSESSATSVISFNWASGRFELGLP